MIHSLQDRLLVALLRRLPTERLHLLVREALRQRGGVKALLSGMSDKTLVTVIGRSVADRARRLPAAEGLRLLFHLDSDLYPVQGELATTFDKGVHTKHRHTQYHEFFIRRIKPQERVLDIGCGLGALGYDVAVRTGATVVGVDLSDTNIQTARERFHHANITYLCGDVLVDLPAEQFDVVILSNVLEHLPDRPRFLKRVRETASPHRFLIRVPVLERDWRVPLKKELGVEWRLDPTHEIEYTLESFAAEMVEAGLRVVHQEVRWGEIWAEASPAPAMEEGRQS